MTTTSSGSLDVLAALSTPSGLILASDAAISEEVKWNAPSFRTTEHFATMNLRDKKGIGVIMHFGAKKRDIKPRASISDPAGLLEWLAEDRATVSFKDVPDIEAKRTAYTNLIREWIALV